MSRQNTIIGDLVENRKKIGSQLGELNNRLIKESDQVIADFYQNAEQWQDLLDRSIKRTSPILERQIDMVANSLVELKGQYRRSRTRWSELLGQSSQNNAAKQNKDKKSKQSNRVTRVKEAGSKGMNDFVSIKGIGPKTAKVLLDAGIRNFNDLASLKEKELHLILDQGSINVSAEQRKNWIKEALKKVQG